MPMLSKILHGLGEKYQEPLDKGYKGLTNFCGFCGCILGFIIVCLTLKYLEFPFEIDFDKGMDQFSHPNLMFALIMIYIAIMFFVGAFICHLPFVMLKKITLSEAFRAVFLVRHPKRWRK